MWCLKGKRYNLGLTICVKKLEIVFFRFWSHSKPVLQFGIVNFTGVDQFWVVKFLPATIAWFDDVDVRWQQCISQCLRQDNTMTM